MALTLGPASSESSIYSQVRRKLHLSPTVGDGYSSTGVIAAYANEALNVLASDSRSRRKSNIGSEGTTTAGTRLYALPSDTLEVLRVYCGQTQGANGLTYKPIEWLEMQGPSWWSIQGQPLYYYFDYTSTTPLALWPTPSVTGMKLTIFYIVKPATLSADADVPTMDTRLDMALIYKVAAMIYEDKREPGFAKEMHDKYDEVVKKYLYSGRDSRERPPALNYQYRMGYDA